MVKPFGSSGKSKPAAGTAARTRKRLAPALSPDSPDTEQRILAAARAEFVAKGLAGARMQVIASEAGVNKALLHYYYRSKDKLYQTVLKDIFQSVWSRMSREMLSQNPSRELEPLVRTFVSTYIRTMAANPDFPLFIFRELATGGETLQPTAEEMLNKFRGVPESLIKALQAETKAGKIRPIKPVQFFLNLAGMCVVTFLAMPIMRKLEPAMGLKIRFDEAFMNERIEAITSMILHGLKNKG